MKKICLFLVPVLLLALLTGCGSAQKEIYAMDTIITMEAWGDGGEAALTELQKILNRMEADLSVTRSSSVVSRLNSGQTVTLDEDTAALLKEAMALCEATGGALDIGLYAVSRLWGFTTGEYSVPAHEELQAALAVSGWERLTITGQTAFLGDGAMVDLGAVAKGWAGKVCVRYLEECPDVTCALLALGGNIQTYGTKEDGSPWQVGIQNPAGEGVAGVLSLTGTWSVVTSGGYQRYFEEDGQRHCHILDGSTGQPARSGLASVTIVSRDGLLSDGLSTALYVMGLEKATAFWRERTDFEAVFITDSGEMYVTEGLERSLTDCEPQVIRR